MPELVRKYFIFVCSEHFSNCKRTTGRSKLNRQGIWFLKNLIHSILIVTALSLFGSLHAQSLNEGAKLVDARIDLKETAVKGSFVVIEYEIPYSGMVEIRLFDKTGNKIWQNQYPDQHGENRIVLKASKFNPGETYTYALNYKKDEVKEKIIVPPMGYD